MRKKVLNEEIKRMQFLAGIIKENTELTEIGFHKVIEPIRQAMREMGYEGGEYNTLIEGYMFVKQLEGGVMDVTITELYQDEQMLTFTATFYPEITKSKLFGLIKTKAIDFKGGKTVSKDNNMEIIDLGTGMFSLDEPGVADMIKSKVQAAEQEVASGDIKENEIDPWKGITRKDTGEQAPVDLGLEKNHPLRKMEVVDLTKMTAISVEKVLANPKKYPYALIKLQNMKDEYDKDPAAFMAAVKKRPQDYYSPAVARRVAQKFAGNSQV